jgi:hypothetical protein
MLEAPEVEPHHHHTGHSKIDLILGCLAVFLSCVSVFIALKHGDTMERLVAANTWPNLAYGTSNENPDKGIDEITLDLRNTGVGPARIETFEVFYKDKPMADTRALITACCFVPGQAAHPKLNLSTSTVRNEVLPARETISFIGLLKSNAAPEIWDIANTERMNVSVRVCYCSVFDECWMYDSRRPRPARVNECKATQEIQFSQ